MRWRERRNNRDHDADFNHNNGFYKKPLIAVWGGRVNDMIPLSYFSPMSWKPGRASDAESRGRTEALPAIARAVDHIADETIGSFAFDFARTISPGNSAFVRSVPKTAPAPLRKPITWPEVGIGTKKRDTGLAVAMPSSNFPGEKVWASFNSDYMWRNRNFHLSSQDSLDGIAAKELSGT